jgi:HSP20 family protein
MRIDVQASGGSFDHLAEQMWSMLGQMTEKSWFQSHGSDRWRPKLNLYETPAWYVVCIELAGMQRTQIDVRVCEGMLEIRGSRRRPELPKLVYGSQESPSPDEMSVHVMEIDSGPFHRKLRVPSDCDEDRITALYKHGYLWILLPRKSE